MIPLVRLAGLGLVSLLAQVLLAELPRSLRPDLVLVFALGMGLLGRPLVGLWLAFGFGFAMDVLSGSPLGLFALLRGTACALTRLLDRALFLRGSIPWAVYVAAWVTLDTLLMAGVLHVFTRASAPGSEQILALLPARVPLTALLAVPLLPVFLRFGSKAERDGLLPSLSPHGPRSRP